MKSNNSFIAGFLSLFNKENVKFAFQKYKYSILLFIISFTIFFFISKFFFYVFENVLIQNFLFSISNKFIYTAPLYYFQEIITNPLQGVFYPVIIYLSYISTLFILSLFKGFLLDPLSEQRQKTMGYKCGFLKRRKPFKHFLFNLTEEMKLLLFTIFAVFSLFFFVLNISNALYTALINFIFIFINGIVYLSYAFLRWGYGYFTISKLVLKKPGRVFGLGAAVTLMFFFISIAVASLTKSLFLFSFIFALNSILFIISVIAGTENAVLYVRNKSSLDTNKSILTRIAEWVVYLCAIVIIITCVQVFFKSKTKVKLLNCEYRVKEFDLGLKYSNDLGIKSLLKRFRIKTNPQLTLKLKILNPTKTDIHVFSFYLIGDLNGEKIISKKIKGGVVKSRSNNIITLKVNLNTIKLGVKVLKSLIKGDNMNVRFYGKFLFQTWLGQVPVIFNVLN